METIAKLKDLNASLKQDYARFILRDGRAARLRLENTTRLLESLLEEFRKDLLRQKRALKAKKST